MKLNRRDFLKKCPLVAGIAALTGFLPKEVFGKEVNTCANTRIPASSDEFAQWYEHYAAKLLQITDPSHFVRYTDHNVVCRGKVIKFRRYAPLGK